MSVATTIAPTVASESLGSDLLGVVARLNRLATQRADIDLPYAQVRLLAQVEQEGAARISELAAADHCAQPTMTTQVQRLETGGWVQRRPDPSDARAVLVSITPAGAAAIAKARAGRAAVVGPHLARLDEHERETLADAIAILRRVLASAGSTQETVSSSTKE